MKTQVYRMRLDCIFSFIYMLAPAKRTEYCDFISNLHFELALYCILNYIDMTNTCKHEKIALDDFISHETDEKGSEPQESLEIEHRRNRRLKFLELPYT